MSQRAKIARLPVVGKVRINFYGLAEKCIFLYEKCNEFERQKEVKHLGIIPNVFEGVSHTRYEYLLLQCALCDMADAFHKGTPNTQGEIKINGTPYAGNAIIKTWFMLSNFGHCKYTVSDEKCLLSYAHRNAKFKRNLLQPIKDKSVKLWCKKTIDNYDYMNFHNVISFRRIYKNLPRRVQQQTELVNALKLLLLPYEDLGVKVDENKLKSLKRIHDNLRHLAMIGIDSHHSHTSISLEITSILLDLNEGEQLYREWHIANKLDPFFSILCEELYLEPTVLARQKSYETTALQNLGRKSNCSEILTEALNKGLSDPTQCDLLHFSRFIIPKDMQPDVNFYRELRRINLVRRNCKSACSSLDIFPVTGDWCADFFIDINTFTPSNIPSLLHYQAELIEDQMTHLVQNQAQHYTPFIGAIYYEANRMKLDSTVISNLRTAAIESMISTITPLIIDRLRPAFKELLWGLIRYVLKSKYEFDIESGRGHYDSFGFYSATSELGSLSDNIDTAINMESADVDRVHELKQIKSSAKRQFSGYTLCCISRITIYDTTKPPSQRKATDIDGVVLKISNKVTVLEFHESKNMKQGAEGTATKELRKMLVPTLNRNASGYRVKPVAGYGAKLVIRFAK